MAFWGIEVKPGKPFRHHFDSLRGRLKISQATLGIGSSTQKSLIQCNIANKTPIYICSLLPDQAESCYLNLEFEEADEVIFSVLGPRSVHLTGYYLRNGHHSNPNEDTDSYGEDIGQTESEDSIRDEDDYEDSFIDDDDDPKACPPSPLSNGRVVIEETSDDDKPKQRKVHKRLKKKYQLSESDNDAEQQKVDDPRNGIVILESEDEDSLPFSFICKTKNTADNTKVEEEKKNNGKGERDKETEDNGNCITEQNRKVEEEKKNNGKGERDKETEDNGNCITEQNRKADDALAIGGEPERQSGMPTNSLVPSTEVSGPEIDAKRKKKRKERSKEKKPFEDCCDNNISALDEDKTKQDDTKSNSMGQYSPLKDQQTANDKGDLSLSHSMPSTEVSPARLKKKRKERGKEEKPLEAENDLQDEGTADNMCLDQCVTSEPHSKPDTDDNLNIDAEQKQHGEKKIKKRKGRKNQENEEDLNTNVPRLSGNEVNTSVTDIEEKNSPVNSSQIRKLSNGLIIEELETGKPDGKVASQGKKVRIRYVGKLKESGQIFDSNIDGAPYKFRLGADKVIEGWNVGLDGMRVGDKRRLEIPPSMGYGSQGDDENVPPNSWLVFDVEMVAVR